MSKKSLVLLLLLALLPLAAVAWLGWRVARAESVRVQSQFQMLLEDRLAENNRVIQQYFAGLQRAISGQVDNCGDTSATIRQLVRQSPQVRQVVVFNRRGDVVHPPLSGAINESEREFLNEIAEMIRDKDLVRLAFQTNSDPLIPDGSAAGLEVATAHVPGTPTNGLPTLAALDADPPADMQPAAQPPSVPARIATTGKSSAAPLRSSAVLPDSSKRLEAVPGASGGIAEGWFTWYWGRGLNLMYWRRWSDDRLTVVALPRARWIADLLALLPETKQPADAPANASTQCIRLVDSSDQVIYQWGQLEPPAGFRPQVETPVIAPLSSWRLKYYVASSAVPAHASRWPLVAGLAGLACGLIGLAIVLYREYSRDMREALQRVHFVNQVSHELKTPLTNIRLYADLLESDLDRLQAAPPEALEKPRSRLSVITSESQRLSRLITHVLTFARAERNQLTARHSPTDLDQLVRDVAERFRPALEAEEMRLEVSTSVAEPIWVDPDMVEQILDNLISNVQRYAASGRYLQVRTYVGPGHAIVEVADRGPGIPAKLARKLFQPFVRGAHGLSDCTGTGIGLSIARRLARLQGGDLIWVPSDRGATFRLILAREEQHEGVTGRG